MNRMLTLLVAMLAACTVRAAIADYQFTSMSGTYTEISGGTALVIPGGSDGADYAQNVTLPFTFNYCGTDYTTARISENGFLQIGQSYTMAGNYNGLAGAAANKPFIAALWDDLEAREGGEIRYETSGTAPNRIFTVQWKNVNWYQAPGSDQNFQIKLYETSNNIQLVYGTMTAPVASDPATYFGASIGIRDAAAGGSGHFISVTPNAPATFSSLTANDLVQSVDYLQSGTIYSFLAMASVANDLAVSEIKMVPGFIYNGESATITAKILNNGTALQADKEVVFKVDGNVVSTQSISSLAVGTTVSLSYDWTPAAAGNHVVRVEVAADQNTANDFLESTFEILEPAVQFNAGFEGGLNGWSGLNFGAGNTWGIVEPNLMNAPFNAHSGSKVAILTYNTDGNNDWLVTPRLQITADNENFQYFAKTGLPQYHESWNIRVWDTSLPQDTANYVVVDRSRDISYTGWTQRSVNLSAFIGKVVEVAFQGISVDQDYLAIDDISLSDLTDLAGSSIPEITILSQNYPNPFNPETTINFALANQGKVALTVYNAKGEMVAELVNEVRTAGNHSVKFNAAGMNSGVYFYKLTTPERSMIQKMVLCK